MTAANAHFAFKVRRARARARVALSRQDEGTAPAGTITWAWIEKASPTSRGQRSRSGAISRPTMRSDSPLAYTSAVSIPLMLAPRAESTMRAASGNSEDTHAPARPCGANGNGEPTIGSVD